MLDVKTAKQTASKSHSAAGHVWDKPGVASHDANVLQGHAFVHQNMPVSSIMTTDVVAFPPDTSIEEATRILLERGISGAPVVDAAMRPTGMISKTDLLEAWQQRIQAQAQGSADDGDSEVHVGDIMVPYLLAISHRGPISLATALMAYEGVHRLVVLGENNKMVGIVTSLDIVRWVAELSGFSLARATRLQRALG